MEIGQIRKIEDPDAFDEIHALHGDDIQSEWIRAVSPFWGSSLCRLTTYPTFVSLILAITKCGIRVDEARNLSLNEFGNRVGNSLNERDVGILHGILRNNGGGGMIQADNFICGNTGQNNYAYMSATAPNMKFHTDTTANFIASCGMYRYTMNERNVHGSIAVAEGGLLLTLWKSLQDETIAAKNGVGQDVYFGVLAATVPLLAVSVVLSLVLTIATQISAATDLSAARYLATPSFARYSDVIMFAISLISTGVSHAFLLNDTPQGDWVTWIFVASAATGLLIAVPIAFFVIWGVRRPFGVSKSQSAIFKIFDKRFMRFLEAGGEWRRQMEGNEVAHAIRKNAILANAAPSRARSSSPYYSSRAGGYYHHHQNAPPHPQQPPLSGAQRPLEVAGRAYETLRVVGPP
jgi:hypothetical protein